MQAKKALGRIEEQAIQIAPMVSVLAEEHQEACYRSNCFPKMLLQSKERLDRGRDVEKKYSGDRRKYDDSLTVAGDYYEERRSAMQKAGYSDEDMEVRLNQPSPAGYQGEVKENREHQEKFSGSCFFSLGSRMTVFMGCRRRRSS